MDIKDFTKNTIQNIIDGVSELKESNNDVITGHSQQTNTQLVKFSVSVKVNSDERIIVSTGSSSSGRNGEEENISKIEFSIPIDISNIPNRNGE